MPGAICPNCGKWYGRTEFPTCYDCGVKAGRVSPTPTPMRGRGAPIGGFSTSAPGTAPTAPEILPPLQVPPESPLAAVMLEVAVGSFLAVNWQKKGKEAEKVRIELIKRCKCWDNEDDDHFTYPHVAELFGVKPEILHDAIQDKLHQERTKDKAETVDTTQPEEPLEPVSCWRLFSLTTDAEGRLALKGSHGAIWQTGTLEAECLMNGKSGAEAREQAIQHLSSRLVSNNDWPPNDGNLMPIRPVSSRDGCGIYGVIDPGNLHDTGGSLKEGFSVSARCLAHGVVWEGADNYWLKSSEMTIEELFIECTLIQIDGEAGPPIPERPSNPWQALKQGLEPIVLDPAYEILAEELRNRYDCTVELLVQGKVYRIYERPIAEVIDPDTVAPWLLAGLGYEQEDEESC